MGNKRQFGATSLIVCILAIALVSSAATAAGVGWWSYSKGFLAGYDECAYELNPNNKPLDIQRMSKAEVLQYRNSRGIVPVNRE